MASESSRARELTHRLVSQSRTDPDDQRAEALAACDVCESVALEFSRWVGTRGFEALMARVLPETRARHVALEEVRYQVTPAPELIGVPDSIERHGPAAVTLALTALLETVLSLLIRLIGEELVEQFVERSMKNARYRSHPHRNPDDGSATS